VARPDTQVYSEPSPRVWADWSPPRVKAVLQQLQRGDLSAAGGLADAVLADDRVQAALGTRINGVLGLPLAFEASDDTPAAARAAELLEIDWWAFADEATLVEWISYALLVGACLAELVWDTSGERSLPRLKVWHPSNTRRKDGKWEIRQANDKWLPVEPGDGKWALLAPFGERRAGTRALIRGVAIAWLSKAYALSDWNRYSEIHGSPTRVGRSPMGASADERRSFRDDLASLAHDSSIVVPDGWTVELLEAKIGSGEVFKKLIDWADKAISIAILGQNLTTDVEGGSLAAAKVHENVRADLVQADAEVVATTTHDEVVTWWAEFNLGRRDLAPWPKWDTMPPVDERELAEALGARAQALLTLSTAQLQTGLPIDWPALAGQLGIPLVEGAPLAAPQSLERLADVRGLRLASGDDIDTARGFVRGQVYADRLVDVSTGRGATAMRPVLDRVLDLVRSATSYDEIRNTLLSEYAGLDVDDLADLTESTLLLASLSGRLAVIDDA